MPSFVGHFPIFEFINMGSPMIFMKVGDRQIDLIKARRIQGKFFMTNLGVFELDGEYENKMMGQSFYIHNLSNCKPISLRHIEKIQKLYRENKAEELTRTLSRINNACDDVSVNYKHALEALTELSESKPNFLTMADIKFFIHYKTFDKSDIKIFNFTKMMQKKTELDVSKKVPTITPILLMGMIGVGIVVLMRFFNPLKLFNIPLLIGSLFGLN